MNDDTRRLLLVSPFPPPADGIGSHTRMLAAALREHAAVVIAAPGGGARTDIAEGVQRVLAPWQVRERSALLATVRPEALFVQFAIASYSSSLLGLDHLLRSAHGAGIPITTAFHEPQREQTALPLLGRAIYRRIAALTDVPIAYGEAGRAALLDAGIVSGGVSSIPLGVPQLAPPSAAGIEAVRARYGLTGRLVLMLGFIHPDKGADVLIGAARPLLQTHPDVTVVIAGEPRVRRGLFRAFGRVDARHLAELQSAAAWAGNRIRFPGFIDDIDLSNLLAAASVMVLPYRRITQSSIATLCVAGAVPTVASRLDGLMTTLDDGAVYVPPGDALPLAAALAAVLDDDDGRAIQRRALEARRDAWTPAAIADRIVEVTFGGMPSGVDGSAGGGTEGLGVGHTDEGRERAR